MAKIGNKSSLLTKITRSETGALTSEMAKKGGLTKKEVRDLIDRATNDGEDIISFMVNVMMGRNPRASVTAQMQAGEWLGSYFFGKPVETTVQVSMTKKANSGGPLPDISDEQLEELIRGGHLSKPKTPPRLPRGDIQDAGGGSLPDGAVGLPEVQEGVVEGVGDVGGEPTSGDTDEAETDVEEGPDDE